MYGCMYVKCNECGHRAVWQGLGGFGKVLVLSRECFRLAFSLRGKAASLL